MHGKKTPLFKAFLTVIKRFFRARNIIIISEHKVDHLPLSAVMQVLLIIGVVGFFSGVSYITGSYMTARSSLKEKDQKIVSTTIERTRISEEADLLKHDLVKLGKNSKELSSYSKFVLDQYATKPVRTGTYNVPPEQFAAGNVYAGGTNGQGNERLIERISYLESRMQEIREDSDRLVSAIHDRTDKKITYFEDIIAMTGLNSGRLEHAASASLDKHSERAPSETKKGQRPRADRSNENQGGPFIPYDSTAFNDYDRELLANVDRLVLLHDIVEQLPLRQPIMGAQQMSPFGRRVDPINGRWSMHPGVDLAGPSGSGIYATNNGKVAYAGKKVAYGNVVDIEHGFGIATRYAHMSKILVKAGDVVHKGQQIGVQGSTGRSTGAHLHYEVRLDDHPINPSKFLHAGEYVSENE